MNLSVAVGSGLNEAAPRRAFTLIELMIVIAIMVIVAAFLIPAIKPALADRKIREAARQVNALFAGAQARAIEKGRPVGVWLERNPNSPNECLQVYLAESPLPYSGDTLGARAKVVFETGASPSPFRAEFDANSASLSTLVKAGDTIRFDYKGPHYLIVGVTGNAVYFVANNLRAPQSPVANSTTTNPAVTVPYQIERQPTRSTATTFALPSATAINLYYSGAGAGGFGPAATAGFGASATTDTSPVLIMFSPGGRLDRVYAQGTGFQATESVYLFLARGDKQRPDGTIDPVYPENLNDLSNLWVTVGHRTGSVATVENASSVHVTTDPIRGTTTEQNLSAAGRARWFARAKTSMGAR